MSDRLAIANPMKDLRKARARTASDFGNQWQSMSAFGTPYCNVTWNPYLTLLEDCIPNTLGRWIDAILDLIGSCSWPPPYCSLSFIMSYDLLHHDPSSECIFLYDLYLFAYSLFMLRLTVDDRSPRFSTSVPSSIWSFPRYGPQSDMHV